MNIFGAIKPQGHRAPPHQQAILLARWPKSDRQPPPDNGVRGHPQQGGVICLPLALIGCVARLEPVNDRGIDHIFRR